MIAYHGKEEIKQEYLARVRAHRAADEIIKGQYWEDGKGCAVGCTIHSGDHSDYEKLLGIPRILARLEDGIFEALPNDLAMTWPEIFLESIAPSSDLTKVWNKFAHWLLVDPKDGVIKYAKTDKTKYTINNVANLYLRSLKEQILESEWIAAANAANAADAANAAANAAAYADAADAAAAAANAAAYAARIHVRIKQSEKLLELLKECK